MQNCPYSRYSKYSSYSRIVKFGRKCEIWSTPISLVWKGLTEFITIGQTQTFSRIAIRGCSLNISKNHSLPLGLLSKCICHRHGLCLCLCCCLFVGSGHVLLSLWSNVSKVKSLKDCSLKVFSKCNCHCLCLWICLCCCVHVSTWPPSALQGFDLVWKALNPTQPICQNSEWQVSEWPR